MSVESRPDLRELESVQSGNSRTSIVGLGVAGYIVWQACLIGYLNRHYGECLDNKSYIPLILMFSIVIYMISRIILGYCFYETDANGITMRGLIRRRFVPWMDIEGAEVCTSRIGTVFLLLKIKGRVVRIAPSDTGSSRGDCLIASVWQHLRHFGRADGIELTETALSLWQPIPDDVPIEMEWGKSPSSKAYVSFYCGMLFFGFLLLACFIFAAQSIGMILMLWPVVIAFPFLLRRIVNDELNRGYKISVEKGGLEACTLFGIRYIPWSSVSYAGWQIYGGQQCLVVRSANRYAIHLPTLDYSPERDRLTTAVIRHLRKAGVPQAITLPSSFEYSRKSTKVAAGSGRSQIRRQLVYIRSLPEPARSRIHRLYNLDIGVTLSGIIVGILIPVTDVLGRLCVLLHTTSDTRYVLHGQTFIASVIMFFVFLSGFGSIGTLTGSRLAGDYGEEWEILQSIQCSLRKRKLQSRLAILGFGAGLIVFIGYVNQCMRITDRGLGIRRPFELHEHFYSWNQVQRIALTMNGRTSEGRCANANVYVVTFADGTSWKFSVEDYLPFDGTIVDQSAQYISKKLDKKIEYE